MPRPSHAAANLARAFLAALACALGLAAHAQALIAQLPVATDPRAIVVNPTTNRIYVAVDSANAVQVIDGQTNATTAIAVCGGPQYLAVDTDTNRIFAACGRSASLAVIDGATNAVTVLPVGGAGPMVVDPVTHKLYMVRLGNADEVTVVDPVTREWYTMAIDSYGPVALDLNPATRQLFVATYATGDLRIVDLRSTSDFPPTATLGMWSHATHVAVDRAANRAFVLTEDARGPIAVIDANTLKAGFLTPSGHAIAPRGLAVDERTHRAYAAFERELVVVDGATQALAFVPLGSAPIGIAFDGTANRAYLPSATGTLSIVDGASRAVSTVAIASGARVVAVNPATGRVYVAGTSGVSVVGNGTPVAPPPPPTESAAVAVNAQGLWWASPAGSESGWGVHLTHQGEIVFGTWFTYDLDGSGMWLVMSNGARVAPNMYSGDLYRTTGPPFSSEPFDPAKVVRTQVGRATVSFTDADNGTFTAVVNNQTISKPITRQAFSAPMPQCVAGAAAGAAPNYQDLWWRAPAGSESGWGVNIAHQGDVLFVTWFTYGADGKGLWLVGSNVARTGPSTYAGLLYRAAGPAYNAPWRPGAVALAQAGTVSFAFSDAYNGVMTFSVDGHSGTRAITRQAFANPATICR